MSITETQAKNRSYTIREGMALQLGRPLHADFRVDTRTEEVWVCLDDDRCGDILRTSNAGFRGIEATFEDHETGETSTISLGRVTSYEVVVSTPAL